MTDEKDVKMMGLIGFNADAESDEEKEAYLGDRPNDVIRVKTTDFIGVPLTLPDGRVMLWNTVKEEDRRTAQAVVSSDNGISWSKPFELFTFPERRDCQWYGGAALADDKGYIHLFGLEYYSFSFEKRHTSKSLLYHVMSQDGGNTWLPIKNPDFGYSYTGSSNNAFQSNTGRIFAPISALSDRKIGVWVSLCPYSDDNGLTWNKPVNEVAINTGAADWYESGAAEPVGIQLKDGRIWLLPRSQDGFHWETYSYDDGITWTKPKHTRFISNQSAMAITRLKDRSLLLIWNNCGADGLGPIHWGAAERAVAAAAISFDEGKTWKGYREIGRVISNSEIGYPYVTEMPNGRVLVKIGKMLVDVDPKFLLRTRFDEDFRYGLRRWSTLAAHGPTIDYDPFDKTRKVMKVVKPKSDVPSGACINFPYGEKGSLAFEIMINEGFQGAHFTLSDHFDLPGLEREGSFPVVIDKKGRVHLNGSGGSLLPTPGDLTFNQWHTLSVRWDCREHEAELYLDDEEIGRLHQYVCTEGLCYFRTRLLSKDTDLSGFFIRSLTAETE